MAIIREIDGMPLFSKAREALEYGKAHNLTGYHFHKYSTGPNMYRTGYMPGETHEALSNRGPSATTTYTSGSSSGSSGSGSGSGGGY